MTEPIQISRVDDFLRSMNDKGVSLGRDGGALRVSAPKGVLTSTDSDFVRDHKDEILAALGGDELVSSASSSQAVRGNRQPLSYQQEKIWSHQQMFPEMALYNLAGAWRISGDLDCDALSRALRRVVKRHAVLRARFEVIDGDPSVCYRDRIDVALPVETLSESVSEDGLIALLEQWRDAPMALDAGDVFRARLIRLSPTDHIFAFAPHHVIWDGLCWDVFLRDLSAFYDEETGGAAAALPPLNEGYSGFSERHRNWMKSGAPGKEFEFWRRYYEGDLPALALPCDGKRPKLFNYEGSVLRFDMDPSSIAAARALAARVQCTSFVVFLTAWQAFLHRITGQTDVIVGAPSQGRHHGGDADLIGCFGNVLGMRAKIDPSDSFLSVLTRTRDIFYDVLDHQQTPIEYIASHLKTTRDVSRTPLFQAMFTYQNESDSPRAIGALPLEAVDLASAGAPTDIRLEIVESVDGATGRINYASAAMSANSAQYFANSFAVFLKNILASTDKSIADIEIMSPDEKKRILNEWNDTHTAFRHDALSFDYFDDAAAQRPDAPAVSMGDDSLSYAQLQTRANQIGNFLRAGGIEEGDIVAVYMDRSIDMVASILGLWKAGAALLPIDPGFPKSRLAYMLEDARAQAVITTTPLIEDWLCDAAPVVDLAACATEIAAMATSAPSIQRTNAAARAYVIYTSGSTGDPKGVENDHRALCNFIEAMMHEPGMAPDDRLLAVTTISFDVMLLELFVTLSAGAEIVLASDDDAMDGFALADIIERRDITVLQGTPATWRILFDAEWRGKPDMTALCGGEAMPREIAERLPKLVGALWNMYGPTETTVWSTCGLIENGDNIHVGRPIQNTQIYVLDDAGNPAPAGVAGDLWIGGAGVARGYLGKPALTAERFRANPFDPDAGRIYNTGDRAHWRRNGDIEILGRRDEQVKVRGYRIELGDIEAALNKFPGVREAAAALRNDLSGEASLVAYVVFKDGESATNSELRRFMRKHVPHYMTPQFFMELSALPLTNNNKVDRKALPAPTSAPPQSQDAPPRTKHEIALADIWRDVLNTSEISASDNFFDLGGQSLQAARMIVRARESLGLTISPREVIFETLEQLAAGAAAA